MQQILQKIISEKLNLPGEILKVDKLFGHASYRTYYRAHLSNQQTYVIMQMPEGLSSVSEEITNYQGDRKELPYLNIQRYLKNLEIPVPSVLGWFEEERLMVLEDLGDRLLESYLQDTPETLKISFYKKAIDLLILLQIKTSKSPSKACMAYHRSFDETLLNWEFNHFLEYGIEDRFQIKVPETERHKFIEWTRPISHKIAQSPILFVHRDFQSRNLMMKDYQLYLIDFQDALQGPEVYDLVALLRDSYIVLSMKAVEILMDYYLEKREKEGFPVADKFQFQKLFYLVTLQRKLKDTGRFQFIHTVKKNPNFLVSVPASLGYIREAFEKLPELKPLQEWISQYVSELR